MTQLLISIILTIFWMLSSCGTNTPTLGLAPTKQLVQKAIAFQVSQTQQQLTQQLQSPSSQFDITQVKLKQIEPFFIENLATYRVLGTYSLTIELPKQRVTQQKNLFDIYLQRQQEGKTWRLAVPQAIEHGKPSSWRTYLIR
ncbi:MAG: hypothetical protein F6J86_16795 [Symploca sp. SIO1B1]|nr:hypothetical protein [Symploca sp. SIO2D2]NER46219.1 hypothetical protein [Symploca sp. SIO1A3]NER95470.1 hypothetical protein [Symploca sp. SIO1B1]